MFKMRLYEGLWGMTGEGGGRAGGKPLLGVVAAYGNRLIVFAVLLF